MSESGIGPWLAHIGLEGWTLVLQDHSPGSRFLEFILWHPDGREVRSVVDARPWTYDAYDEYSHFSDAIYEAAYQAGAASMVTRPAVICEGV